MSTNKTINAIPREELVGMLQEGRINFLQFVMNGPHNRAFIEYCKEHGVEPDNGSAEFFCEMTEFDMLEHQYMDAMVN